jgi:hypothetical protein
VSVQDVADLKALAKSLAQFQTANELRSFPGCLRPTMCTDINCCHAAVHACHACCCMPKTRRWLKLRGCSTPIHLAH